MSNDNSQLIAVVADWESACEAVFAVRQSVWLDAENRAGADEPRQDTLDAGAWHVVVSAPSERPIAVARLLSNARIDRIAVLTDYRNSGVVGLLIESLLAQATECRFEEICADLPVLLCDEFDRFGFNPDPVSDLTTYPDRLWMRRDLKDDSDVARVMPVRELVGADQILAELTDLVARAGRRFDMYLPYLHPQIFDKDQWVAALKTKIADQPRIQVRLLLPEVAHWRYRAKSLAAAVTRYSSAIELRHWPCTQPRQRREFAEGIVISDHRYIWLPNPRRAEGEYGIEAGRVHRELSLFFTAAWNLAAADQELRALTY